MFNIDIGKGIAVYIFPLILVHFDISKSKLEIQSFQMDSRHLYFIYRTHNTQSIILYSHKISHRLFQLACSLNSTMYAYKQSKMRLNFFFYYRCLSKRHRNYNNNENSSSQTRTPVCKVNTINESKKKKTKFKLKTVFMLFVVVVVVCYLPVM